MRRWCDKRATVICSKTRRLETPSGRRGEHWKPRRAAISSSPQASCQRAGEALPRRRVRRFGARGSRLAMVQETQALVTQRRKETHARLQVVGLSGAILQAVVLVIPLVIP